MSSTANEPDKFRLSIWVNPEKDPEIYHFFRDVFEGNVSSTARMLMSIGAKVLLMTPGVVSKEYGIEFGNMLPVTLPAGTYENSFASLPTPVKRAKKTTTRISTREKTKTPISENPKTSTAKPTVSQTKSIQPTNQVPVETFDKPISPQPTIASSSQPSQEQLLAAAKAFEALDSRF